MTLTTPIHTLTLFSCLLAPLVWEEPAYGWDLERKGFVASLKPNAAYAMEHYDSGHKAGGFALDLELGYGITNRWVASIATSLLLYGGELYDRKRKPNALGMTSVNGRYYIIDGLFAPYVGLGLGGTYFADWGSGFGTIVRAGIDLVICRLEATYTFAIGSEALSVLSIGMGIVGF